ncbi:MAG: hypothetical protein AAB403_00935 [Planctomycetota bacterium]
MRAIGDDRLANLKNSNLLAVAFYFFEQSNLESRVTHHCCIRLLAFDFEGHIQNYTERMRLTNGDQYAA